MPDTTYSRVPLGGGGFVMDIDISLDGATRVIRTDVFGTYKWDSATSRWKQLFTQQSILSADRTYNDGFGAYQIRFCEGTPSRMYMVGPGLDSQPSYVFRSDNGGVTWTKLAHNTTRYAVQSAYRMFGPKMAVDPINPDVVYLLSQDGEVRYTRDGGANWTQVSTSAIPLGSLDMNTVAIDWSSSTISGRKSVVYVSTYGNGVYRSTDGGTTWAAMAGSPTTARRMKVGPDGKLWITDNSGTGQNIWRYASSTWTKVGPSFGDGFGAIAIDPNNGNKISAVSFSGGLTHSTDAGATWSEVYGSAGLRVATDIPWLAWCNEDYFSNGDCAIDPLNGTKLWSANGIGVWSTTIRYDGGQPTWTSQTLGNDELIVDQIIKPPSGGIVIACQDRAFFKLDGVNYPTTHGPDRDASIRHGWSVDYAGNNPAFIVGIANGGSSDKSAYSSDGGATWTPFASNAPANAPGAFGGTIAASTTTNFVWFPSNNGRPYYTTNGGTSWALCSFPAEIATTGELGWSFSFYQNRKVVAADKTLTGVFYAYNYKQGLYKSTDSGANWTNVTGVLNAFATAAGGQLKAVPGQTGHLFYSWGVSSPNPYNQSIRRSTNGGVTWSLVDGFEENWCHGFGKNAPSQTYPAVYVAGVRGGVKGIWRSDDNCSTWVETGSDYQTLDVIRDLAGDMDTYGKVYVGLGGSGVVAGVLGVSGVPAGMVRYTIT